MKHLIGLISILILPALSIADDTKSIPQETNSLSVDFTDYYLSVQAQDANIDDLFKEISRKTGVRIVSESPIDSQISIDFRNKGFTRGMKLILSQLRPDDYKGDLKLGKTFSGSIYTVRRIYEQEILARRAKAHALNAEGETLLREGKDYQAYSLFVKALRSDGHFLPAHKNLLTIYQLWEDHEKLSKRLEKVITLEPDNAQNYRLLADAYRLSYQRDKAIQNYEKFISKSQKKEEAGNANAILANMNTTANRDYYQKISDARDLIAARQFEEARQTLREAVDADPSNATAYELLAMVHEFRADYKAAIEWRKRLAELVPDDPKNLLFLGRDLRILSRYQTALQYLREAKQSSRTEYMTMLIENEWARIQRWLDKHREGPSEG